VEALLPPGWEVVPVSQEGRPQMLYVIPPAGVPLRRVTIADALKLALLDDGKDLSKVLPIVGVCAERAGGAVAGALQGAQQVLKAAAGGAEDQPPVSQAVAALEAAVNALETDLLAAYTGSSAPTADGSCLAAQPAAGSGLCAEATSLEDGPAAAAAADKTALGMAAGEARLAEAASASSPLPPAPRPRRAAAVASGAYAGPPPKRARVEWTGALGADFDEAVQELGGYASATVR
jgi:hypothetical protein